MILNNRASSDSDQPTKQTNKQKSDPLLLLTKPNYKGKEEEEEEGPGYQ